jgi:Uma2 family endonuclease
MRVGRSRVRVADICVYLDGAQPEQVPTTPPFLVIEVLSPEDRWARMQEKIQDYLRFGVPFVFVINPQDRRAWSFTKDGSTEIRDGVLRTGNPALIIPLAEIFGELQAS